MKDGHATPAVQVPVVVYVESVMRTRWSRAAGVVVVLIALVVAIAAALWIPYWLAARIESVGVLTLVSVIIFALVSAAGMAVLAKLWGPTFRRLYLMRGLALVSAGFVIVQYVVLLRPASKIGAVTPYGTTRYWQLPTGSRIAYSEFDPPAGVAVRPFPIVFVHGGPGLRQAAFDQRAYGPFADDGFRVFLYDQVGSGLSGFLPHVRNYTVQREVEDLEAVRVAIGAPKMILIGHSWGSTLAAKYMAAHPDRVDKVVFHSPARIWDVFADSVDYSRTDAAAGGLPSFRLLAALFLRDRNPNTAENLLPQAEAEALFAPALLATKGSIVCKGHSSDLPPEIDSATNGSVNPGFNPYVLQQLASEVSDSAADPHAALRSNDTPAILLYPECNYLSWNGSLDYRRTFRHLEIFYFPKAGHYIQLEQPELMHRVIRAFLLDQPDAIPPYTGDTDPRK
jgi:pimeloyl-ACP methyl ester carboxylesterase